MSTQIDTVHDDITSALNAKIEEAFNSFDSAIADNLKNCAEGGVPNSGPAYDAFIRSIRKKALTELNGVKAWIGTHIRGAIIQEVRTSGIYKLHEIKEAITTAEAEKQKAAAEKERIIKTSGMLSDYEKHSLYGHPEVRSSKRAARAIPHVKDDSLTREPVSPNIDAVYQKYASKKKKSIIIGLLVTVVCVIIDFSMIYALFLSANYSPVLAITIAVISAAMLDAPPYVLGYTWTKSEDDSSLLELQGSAESPEADRKNKGDMILLRAMLVVIILAFIAYLDVRVLSFLGGGDFNLAFHAIIGGDWSKIRNVEFSGADFLSTVVPFSTSVVALAVGKMLYPMKTDYIKDSIAVIKDEINGKIKACEEKIIDCEKHIKDLKDDMVTLREEIWAFYSGRKPFPVDDSSFRREVSLAFQKLNLPLYEQTYADCCLLLRNQANVLLSTVNAQLAQYAADQPRVIAMGLSRDEEQYLDDFWIIPADGKVQRPITQSHLESIKNTVNEIVNTLN